MKKRIVEPFSTFWIVVGMGFEHRPQLPPTLLLIVCTGIALPPLN
jgi:hypothetical protein